MTALQSNALSELLFGVDHRLGFWRRVPRTHPLNGLKQRLSVLPVSTSVAVEVGQRQRTPGPFGPPGLLLVQEGLDSGRD